MNPDYLFLTAGGIAVLAALGVLFRSLRPGARGGWIDAVLLATIAAGLFVQGLAPNLKVERNAFVIPASAVSGPTLDVKKIVERERQMKVLSALLTGVGALGLLARHRRLLTSGAGSAETPESAPSQPRPSSG